MPLDLESIESVDEALARAASIVGQRCALRANEGEHSFDSLNARASAIARALGNAGYAGAQHVGYLGLNCRAAVEIMFGTFRAGAIWTPLNGRLPAEVLARAVGETHMRICFADTASVSIAKKFTNARGQKLRVLDVSVACSSLENFVQSGRDAGLPAAPDRTHIAAQIYTSGTSGLPKGVLLSHGALLASRRMERAVAEPWSDWQAGDVNLVCLPNFHVSGALSLVAGIVNLGCTRLLPQFETGAVLEVLRETPPARLLLVPSAIKQMLDDPRARDVDFSKIRFVFYGGSPMPAALMHEIRERIDCGFVQFYGMTETAGRATYLPPEDHRVARRRLSAGKAFPGVRITIQNEAGLNLEAGAMGEICLATPSAMSGYWGRPEESGSALREGWYHTGDVGYLDAEGYLYVVDRLNDKIVTGGENVYPAEVEAALRTHPGVADAAVCGTPDPRWIEAIHAAVVPREAAQLDETSLREWVAARIGAYKSPKRIVFVQALPRSTTGKVLRREVGALIKSH